MEHSRLLYFLAFNAILVQVQGDLSGLHFYLYTKTNKQSPVEIKSSDPSTITNSPFVANQPVKILAHGYTSVYTAEFPRDLKNIYLANATTKYNVIAVDWAQLCSLNGGYPTAVVNTKKVGNEIALLIKALIASGKSSLSDFHFIGHSLGGQVGAFISNNLDNGQKIPRVTGLDPARPGFEQSTTSPNDRLDPTDADLVDVIRTSTGIGSTSKVADPPSGTVDFYPNGGVTQPGCLGAQLCNHSRAYKFYEESVTTTIGFKGYKCTSYTDYSSGTCAKTNGALMGEYVPKTISGTYYLDTKALPPFAKG